MNAGLQIAWEDLWHRTGGTGKGLEIFSDVMKHWSESHRAYHNAEHLEFCLRELAAAPELAGGKERVELAIWFHDVIYDPKSKENEALSGEYFRIKVLHTGLDSKLIEKVSALIEVTQKHQPGTDPESRLICDVDLSILGQDEVLFATYEKAIREEYSWVGENRFREGRAAVLKGFLDRPKIYQTDYFFDRYEKKARENLRRVL